MALLLLLSIQGSAQQTPQVTYSVPLPGELSDVKQWETGMLRCDSEGNIMALRTSHHELIKVGLNGAVALRIDVSGLAGLGDARVISFAPGPNGETYVLASHATVHSVDRADPNKPPRRVESWSLRPKLLRFDANGSLVSSQQMERFEMPWIAVIDSGDFFVVDGAWESAPVVRIYSVEGKPKKQVDLEKTALGSQVADPDATAETHVFSEGDKAFIFVQRSRPEGKGWAAVAMISGDGDILGSAAVNLPKGYYLRDPRLKSGNLFGSFQLDASDADLHWADMLAEIAPSTGAVVETYERPANGYFPACNTPEGMTFFNHLQHTLEIPVLQVEAKP